ncbi:MAG: helix-turn-helix transcriptional regulator [Clostridia bacterium]|nr:helix-turn-helix transcriptional regulator [Clostridia bacterium]
MLADKIIQERKKKGWSQEELAERLDVSRQSVSKWEGGLSVPELDKIIAMSELFGVSTDYLLKDEPADAPTENAPANEGAPRRKLTHAEAEDYVSLVKRLSWRIAAGVALCILSPISLIQLAAFADAGILGEGLAAGLGFVGLFLFIGAALALFIPSGIQLSPYEYLEKEPFDADEGAVKMAKREQAAYARAYRTLITVGIVLFPLGVVPLIVSACLQLREILIISCVNLLLAVVALGVFLIVRACYVGGAYQKILQTGEFDAQNKVKNAVFETVSAIYWCAVTAVYLAVSFLTGAWHITWIIWAVAAVLSPVLEAVLKNGKIRKEN